MTSKSRMCDDIALLEAILEHEQRGRARVNRELRLTDGDLAVALAEVREQKQQARDALNVLAERDARIAELQPLVDAALEVRAAEVELNKGFAMDARRLIAADRAYNDAFDAYKAAHDA